MRYWYDTEFIEDGRTIDLISIGILAEDGREYYAVNSDMPLDRITPNDWLMAHVWPGLPLRGRRTGAHTAVQNNPGTLDTGDARVKPSWVIANEVRDFLLGTPKNVELWADYGAYDHVVLCQLWGSMVRLPKGLPMFTHDVQQEAHRLGVADRLPQQESGLHNALEDARHTRTRWQFLHALASS